MAVNSTYTPGRKIKIKRSAPPGTTFTPPKTRSGSARTIYITTQYSAQHPALDLAGLPIGTPVLAPERLTVESAGFSRVGYGYYVYARDPNQNQVRFGHFAQAPAVKPGEVLNPGDLVGLLGSTGRSSGPHLHFEVRTPQISGTVPTLPYLNALGGLGELFGTQTALYNPSTGKADLNTIVTSAPARAAEVVRVSQPALATPQSQTVGTEPYTPGRKITITKSGAQPQPPQPGAPVQPGAAPRRTSNGPPAGLAQPGTSAPPLIPTPASMLQDALGIKPEDVKKGVQNTGLFLVGLVLFVLGVVMLLIDQREAVGSAVKAGAGLAMLA